MSEDEVHYYAQIADENGLTHSTWSIGGVMFSEPHPFPDGTRLRHLAYDDPAPIFVEIAGPTYLDLWRAADEAIGRSVNKQHRFIEEFRREVPGGPESKPDPTIVHLVTGS